MKKTMSIIAGCVMAASLVGCARDTGITPVPARIPATAAPRSSATATPYRVNPNPRATTTTAPRNLMPNMTPGVSGTTAAPRATAEPGSFDNPIVTTAPRTGTNKANRARTHAAPRTNRARTNTTPRTAVTNNSPRTAVTAPNATVPNTTARNTTVPNAVTPNTATSPNAGTTAIPGTLR